MEVDTKTDSKAVEIGVPFEAVTAFAPDKTGRVSQGMSGNDERERRKCEDHKNSRGKQESGKHCIKADAL